MNPHQKLLRCSPRFGRHDHYFQIESLLSHLNLPAKFLPTLAALVYLLHDSFVASRVLLLSFDLYLAALFLLL